MTQMSVDFEALYKVGAAAAGGVGGGGGGSVAAGSSIISKGSSTTSPGAGASLMSSSVQSEQKSYMAKNVKAFDGSPISEHDFRFRLAFCLFLFCTLALSCVRC